MIRLLLLILLCVFSIGSIDAQQSSRATPNIVSVSGTGTAKFYHANRNEPPRAIEFEERTVAASYFLANINRYFDIPAEFSFIEVESSTDNIGMRHRVLQQYYDGVALEGMSYRVHEKGGFVTSANGRAVRNVNVNTQTTIGEEQAFHLVSKYLNSKDTVVRQGKKLIVSKGFTFTAESFHIAYQFDIDVSLLEQWRISIDARSGQILNKVSQVNSCNKETSPPPPYGTATGMTNYYGSKTIRVETYSGGASHMVGRTEHGGIIGTYDFRNVSAVSLLLFFQWHKVYDFYSSNNTYNDPYHWPAVSVQWAAEQAYEYYYKKHNRNSFDNNGSMIKSYVHVDEDLNNAFWTHNLLAIGDGSNNNPLVELDVIAHELTHGVTQFEANLQYYNEYGALNESFSDIFGKAVEFDLFGDTATWQMAKRHVIGGFRNMSNPNLKNQPDTYAGEMWYTGSDDNGGVHINSGVQNFWFYLLCEGGSGINDHQMAYSVNPIGMDVAARVAYRNLTEYLGPYSNYLDSRIGSMLAAGDLYGNNSSVRQQVDKAWDAVGVIDEPIITGLETYDITATTVKIKGSLMPRGNNVSYHFEYGTTPALGLSTSDYPYSDKVEGILTGLQSQTRYYLRLIATNENGSTFKNSEFTTISLAPLVKIGQTVDVTETTATLYGQVNPNSLTTSFYFEYGTTPALGMVTPTYPLSNATEYLNVSAPITNLQSRQTYYYKLVATNSFASTKSESATFYTAVRPVITSFSPATAPIGTVVTITGQKFNSDTQKNKVSFGATTATIISSSSTEIKAVVPAGASFAPISVLDIESGLSGESVQEFVPTFSGEFKQGSIQLRVASNDYIYQTLVQDMDGDNKPDILARHYLGFSVFLNVNNGGDLTEESFIRSTFNSDYTPGTLSLVDFDGNGLKDIVGRYENGLRIFPNLSVPGYIFFGEPVDVPATKDLQDIVFGDFDMDGHVDMAGATSLSSESVRISVVRNQNAKGYLAGDNFVPYQAKMVGYNVYFLSTSDVNNDGSPDLIISPHYTDFLAILTNTSQPGSFSFDETIVQDLTRGGFAKYGANDLNGDGWKDITSHSPYVTGNSALFENKQTLPGVTLAAPVSLLNDQELSALQPGDVNGDGKVDLVAATERREFILFKNNGNAGGPITPATFGNFAKYGTKIVNTGSGTVETQMTINDLNGDGRPDIINAYSYNYGPHDGYQMEIYQNSTADCLDPSLIKVNASMYSAAIALPSNTNFDQFEIEYTSVDYISWSRVSSATLYNLSPGRAYRIRARAKCYLGFTGYAYIDFITDCVNTSNFSVSNISFSSVSLNASDLGAFEIEYSLAGENQWSAVPQYNNQIFDLLPGTMYVLRFRGRWCYTPAEYKYIEFSTLCPILSTLTITDLTYNSAAVKWTSNFSASAVLEYSSDNVNWTLIDETQNVNQLTPGTQYYVRGRAACKDMHSDFVYVTFTTLCPVVSDLTIDDLSPFSATVSWTDVSATGSYSLFYSTLNGGPITTQQVSSTSFTIEGLNPGVGYMVSVAPQCVGNKEFKSTSFNTVCYVPLDLAVNSVAQTEAELSWRDDFNVLPYSVDYSISGSNVWTSRESSETNIKLSGLRPGARYEVRVHIYCPSVTAPYVTSFFETLLYDETTFAPNPTDGKVTIRPSKDLIGNHFSIYDNTGRVMVDGKLRDYTIDLTNFSGSVFILMIEGEKPIKIFKH